MRPISIALAAALVVLTGLVISQGGLGPGTAFPSLAAAPSVAAPAEAPPRGNDGTMPIPVPNSALVEDVTACVSPYDGELVSMYAGVCEADHKIYKCGCNEEEGCAFNRTPGSDHGACTTPGEVRQLMAP